MQDRAHFFLSINLSASLVIVIVSKHYFIGLRFQLCLFLSEIWMALLPSFYLHSLVMGVYVMCVLDPTTPFEPRYLALIILLARTMCSFLWPPWSISWSSCFSRAVRALMCSKCLSQDWSYWVEVERGEESKIWGGVCQWISSSPYSNMPLCLYFKLVSDWCTRITKICFSMLLGVWNFKWDRLSYLTLIINVKFFSELQIFLLVFSCTSLQSHFGLSSLAKETFWLNKG